LTTLLILRTGLAFGQKLRSALNHCLSVSRRGGAGLGVEVDYRARQT